MIQATLSDRLESISTIGSDPGGVTSTGPWACHRTFSFRPSEKKRNQFWMSNELTFIGTRNCQEIHVALATRKALPVHGLSWVHFEAVLVFHPLHDNSFSSLELNELMVKRPHKAYRSNIIRTQRWRRATPRNTANKDTIDPPSKCALPWPPPGSTDKNKATPPDHALQPMLFIKICNVCLYIYILSTDIVSTK